MSQKDTSKQSNHIQEFKKLSKLSKQKQPKSLKIQPSKGKSRYISHRRIILIITAGRMMMPKALLDV
jgi:hypothetical protein